jgi:hypothetical protein
MSEIRFFHCAAKLTVGKPDIRDLAMTLGIARSEPTRFFIVLQCLVHPTGVKQGVLIKQFLHVGAAG